MYYTILFIKSYSRIFIEIEKDLKPSFKDKDSNNY